MPRKKPKLNHPVAQNNVEILPREILCIIFSFLKEKYLHSASETCKLWFQLIRNDSNLSNHIFLKSDGLKELQTKIEKSDWIWNRWPVLKVLELRRLSDAMDDPMSIQEALDLVKSINFKECSTLEKVMFSVNIDLKDFYPNFYPKLGIATVEQLAFDPKSDNESFVTKQISAVHINLCDSAISRNYSRLHIFNQNMYEYLTDSIQTVRLTVKSITMIKNVSNACGFITDLYVHELSGFLLKTGDFTIKRLFQKFKKLKKCHINVRLTTDEEWQYFETRGPIILNEKFQNKTEVKFVFTNYVAPISSQGRDLIYEALEVTKMPFERSVSKVIEISEPSEPLSRSVSGIMQGLLYR